MSGRRRLFSSTALTPILMLIGSGAALAQAPAVAYPNGTLGGFGGVWQNSGFGAAEGRWTVPLGTSGGAQIDGIAGIAGGQSFTQVAGHVFWRDPATALFGLYGAWTQQFGSSTFRIGPEFEFYSGQVTLSGVAGWASNSGASNFFAQVKGNLYLSENTKVFAGYVYEGSSFITAGFEHLFQPNGLAGFGEVRFGQNSTAAWLGLRFYFGSAGMPGKSLMAREREDVAPLWLHIVDHATTSTSTSTSTSASPSPTAS